MSESESTDTRQRSGEGGQSLSSDVFEVVELASSLKFKYACKCCDEAGTDRCRQS